MDIQNAKDVAKELFISLKDDTSRVNKLSLDELYSVQLKSGVELISSENFEDMKLKDELLKKMYLMKLEKPSLIQGLAIPQILKGSNCAFQSKSGTGKTIAFTVSALQKVTPGNGPQVVILAPTRELCIQIGSVVQSLADSIKASVCLALRNFISESIPEDIVITSPGKILHLINLNVLDTKNISTIILDEADELISNQSFSAQTLKLMKILQKTQKIFFSATYSDFSKKAVNKLVPDCDTFFEKNSKAEKIQLFHLEVSEKDKIDTLKSLFECLTIAQTIIFVGTKHMVDSITEQLKKDGFSVSSVHGGLDPQDRDRATQDFFKAKTKILVTTDVFSRGMDIPQVNLIINFHLPSYSNESMEETYIHRVGRSGRFNRSGFVIDFVANEKDMETLIHIMNYNNTKSKRFTLDALKEIFAEEELKDQ